MLQHLCYPMPARLFVCAAYERLKTIENFKLLAVAYERWSFSRGSKYNDLTLKLLVFFGKLVAEGRWSLMHERWPQPEVRL